MITRYPSFVVILALVLLPPAFPFLLPAFFPLPTSPSPPAQSSRTARSRDSGFFKPDDDGPSSSASSDDISLPKFIPSSLDERIELSSTPTPSPPQLDTDSSGYTLYTDFKSGKQSRVFDALISYPSTFKMKIVGKNEALFQSDMLHLINNHCRENGGGKGVLSTTNRVNGKWLAITVEVEVTSSEMLYSLYEVIDKDPRVKYKF